MLAQALTNDCAVAIAKRDVEHRSGKIMTLNKRQRVSSIIGNKDLGSSILEAINDRLRNDEIILDKENYGSG